MTQQIVNINLFYPLFFILAIIITFVIVRVYNDKLSYKKDIHFKDNDVEITSEAFKKIGEVKNGTPNELILNLQNVENNREIFNHDTRLEELEETVEFLKKENGNLRADYSILKSKFDSLITVIGRDN